LQYSNINSEAARVFIKETREPEPLPLHVILLKIVLLKWNLFKEERVELAIKGVALLPPAKF
jgi:hypothetical protein